MASTAIPLLYEWSTVRKDLMRGAITRRFITSEQMMIGQITFEAGDLVPRHSHANEQITYVLSGALHFWFGQADDSELVVRAGSLVVIPAHLPHRAVALEQTFELDIFCPPRADWLDGSDAYLRK